MASHIIKTFFRNDTWWNFLTVMLSNDKKFEIISHSIQIKIKTTYLYQHPHSYIILKGKQFFRNNFKKLKIFKVGFIAFMNISLQHFYFIKIRKSLKLWFSALANFQMNMKAEMDRTNIKGISFFHPGVNDSVFTLCWFVFRFSTHVTDLIS